MIKTVHADKQDVHCLASLPVHTSTDGPFIQVLLGETVSSSNLFVARVKDAVHLNVQ